jgi:hypothetical protein
MAEKIADLDAIMNANSKKEIDRLYKEWGVWDATPKLWSSTNWGVVAGEKWFVTTNPSAPTYEEMWLMEADASELANASEKHWKKTTWQ